MGKGNERAGYEKVKAPDANMIHGARAETWVEILCTQRFEVFNNPWPQMEDIIPEEKDERR